MVISTRWRDSDAATVRARNSGAKPRLTSASPPFFMKTRREIIVASPSLEFRRAENERRRLRRGDRPGDGGRGALGNVSAERGIDQRAPRVVERCRGDRRT